jgi:hypothetical protein
MNGEKLQSRFSILERPILSPGVCAVCGTAERQVVDFGLDLEFYGRVYFCRDCTIQIGTAFGDLISYDKYLMLRDEKNRLERTAEHAMQEFSKELQNGLAGLDRVRELLHSDWVSIISRESESKDNQPAVEESTDITEPDSESVSVEGTNDVSGVTSRLTFG